MLLLKVVLVPVLVLLITLAGRRWGPSVAGWLAGFPVVAGPTLFFISFDQGAEFGAFAAQATLNAVLANVSFIVVYAWVAVRGPWYSAALAGLCAFGLVGFGLTALHMPPFQGLMAAWLGMFFASRGFPREAPVSLIRSQSAWELSTRCLCAGALSLAVILLAERLGPETSGVLTAFPILGFVLGVFSQLALGGGGAAQLLAGMVRGLYAFTVFCFVLASMLPRVGVGIAFSVAVSVALFFQMLTFVCSMNPR